MIKQIAIFLASAVSLAVCVVFFLPDTKEKQRELQSIPQIKHKQDLPLEVFTPKGMSDASNVDTEIKNDLHPKVDGTGKTVTITPADLHVISKFNEKNGRSKEISEMYDTYSRATLMELAKTGDIFALQKAYFVFAKENHHEVAIAMLNEAAARGSTQALGMYGLALQSALRMYNNGYLTADDIQRVYGVKAIEDKIEYSMNIATAAYHFTAALRGDISDGHFNLVHFQKNTIGREFTKTEWQDIIANAKIIYSQLEATRVERGLGEFDNSYPKEYADFFGLPEENRFLEDVIAHIQ